MIYMTVLLGARRQNLLFCDLGWLVKMAVCPRRMTFHDFWELRIELPVGAANMLSGVALISRYKQQNREMVSQSNWMLLM